MVLPSRLCDVLCDYRRICYVRSVGLSLPYSSNVAFANALYMTWPVGSCDERKCPTAASALCVIRIGELDV